jgi:hypothetical protein
MEPTAALPPVTPFTLQVTPVLELPVTVAAYCDDVPSVTFDAPVRAIDTVAASVVSAELAPFDPQAVSSSTTNVLRIAQVKGRQVKRILFVLSPM